MIKFLHKLPIWVTVFCVMVCSVLSINIQPSFASEPFLSFVVQTFTHPEYMSTNFEVETNSVYPTDMTLTVWSTYSGEGVPPSLSSGFYSVSGSLSEFVYLPDGTLQVGLVRVEFADGSFVPVSIETYDFGAEFFVPESSEEFFYVVYAQSFSIPTLFSRSPEQPLYYSAFQMFSDFIYGEGAVLTAEQNMTLTILATLAALFVVLFPFFIVFLVVRFVIWLR